MKALKYNVRSFVGCGDGFVDEGWHSHVILAMPEETKKGCLWSAVGDGVDRIKVDSVETVYIDLTELSGMEFMTGWFRRVAGLD